MTAALRREVEALGPWFHNLDLGHDVTTAPDRFLGDDPRFRFDRFAAAMPDVTGKAVLRAAGFRIAAHPEAEVHLCCTAAVPYAGWGAPHAVYPARGAGDA